MVGRHRSTSTGTLNSMLATDRIALGGRAREGGAEQRGHHASQARESGGSAISTAEGRFNRTSPNWRLSQPAPPPPRQWILLQTIAPCGIRWRQRQPNPQPPTRRLPWRMSVRYNNGAPSRGNLGWSSTAAAQHPANPGASGAEGKSSLPDCRTGAAARPYPQHLAGYARSQQELLR